MCVFHTNSILIVSFFITLITLTNELMFCSISSVYARSALSDTQRMSINGNNSRGDSITHGHKSYTGSVRVTSGDSIKPVTSPTFVHSNISTPSIVSNSESNGNYDRTTKEDDETSIASNSVDTSLIRVS